MQGNEKLKETLSKYDARVEERFSKYALAPRPLNLQEVAALFEALEDLSQDESLAEKAVSLLENEVRRGSYSETVKKAFELNRIITSETTSYIGKEKALDMLIDMNGGPASVYLANYHKRDDIDLEKIGYALENIFFVSPEAVKIIAEEAKNANKRAAKVIENWANKSWEKYEKIEESISLISVKVGDNISTGHLSPSKHASTRTDKPLHGLSIMEGRDDEANFIERVKRLKEKGQVCMVGGKQFGEGSSRKSATYNLLEVIGQSVDGEPEKKAGGVLIAKSIAPIFENSVIASTIIPIKADTTGIDEGDSLTVKVFEGKIINETKGESIEFKPLSDFTLKKLRAGGMNAYMAKKQLHLEALKYAKELGVSFKTLPTVVSSEKGVKQTLAQKIISYNRLDKKEYSLSGESVEVKVRGVFSQDTTGPMTYDEYLAMSGADQFQSEFVIQSVCHTSECPSSEERDTQRFLQDFSRKRGGVGLNVGEGIIHTIGNRFVLPSDIIVGGDSHTRSERGLSFPAGSDIVAAAMAYGFLEVSVDEEVRVNIIGTLNEGITARDVVSMLVTQAEKDGLGKDIYNGRIIEFAGLENFNRDERYILTNSVAERSASAGVIPVDSLTIESVKHDLGYLKSRYERGDKSKSVVKTIEAFEKYLSSQTLFTADEGAVYAATVNIDLSEYKEPIVAKPHHPDNVAYLSEVSGTPIDEVFIGSCVGGDIASIRAASLLLEGRQIKNGLHFVVIPASEDIYQTLSEEGTLAKLTEAGAVIGIPGCGLCMGNKRRIGSGSRALTTTTRNYKARIGPSNSEAYLAGAHIAALTALEGEIVSLDRYMSEYTSRISGKEDFINRGVV